VSRPNFLGQPNLAKALKLMTDDLLSITNWYVALGKARSYMYHSLSLLVEREREYYSSSS
jgi:hypothetical protein